MRKALLPVLALFLAFCGVVAGGRAGEAMPRVMLLMNEHTVGGYSIDQAEMRMARYLIRQGCSVVDTELVKSRLKRDQALQAMTGSDRAAAALGLDFGADIVIVGHAVGKGSAREIEKTGMRSYRGTVSAKAIRTDRAEILATAEASVSKPHMDDTAGGSEAISAASLKMIQQLYPDMMASWRGGAQQSVQKIEIVIGDVSQVWQLAALQRLLEDMRGMKSVTRRSFVTGVATYEIQSTEDIDSISQGLVLVRDEPFRIRVVGISANKIDAKLVMTE